MRGLGGLFRRRRDPRALGGARSGIVQQTTAGDGGFGGVIGTNNFRRGKMERCSELVAHVVAVDVHASSVTLLRERVGRSLRISHAIEPIERVFDVYVHRLVVIVATVVRFVDDEVHGRPRARRVLRRAMLLLLSAVPLARLTRTAVAISAVTVSNSSGATVVGSTRRARGWQVVAAAAQLRTQAVRRRRDSDKGFILTQRRGDGVVRRLTRPPTVHR